MEFPTKQGVSEPIGQSKRGPHRALRAGGRGQGGNFVTELIQKLSATPGLARSSALARIANFLTPMGTSEVQIGPPQCPGELHEEEPC